MRTDDSKDLRDRISKLSNEQLLNIIEVEPFEYRKEALDCVKAELVARGIPFQELKEQPYEVVDSRDRYTILKKLTTCKNISEAGMLKGLLTANGIACEIKNEYLSMASGELPFAECYPEIWVANDDDFARGKDIIAEWERKEDEQPEQFENWNCQGCGEVNEGQFVYCWKCGRNSQ
jgi:hypothetical protein